MTRNTRIAIALTCALTGSALAQGFRHVPPAPEMKKLDFLVGDWNNVTRFLDDDGNVVREMTNEDLGMDVYTMQPILGGLVIEGGATTEIARSWYLYRPLEKRYVWTAVDSMGNYEIAYGTFEDSRLVFTNPQPRPWPDGGSIMFRRTYRDIRPDAHEILMEYSRDEGKTWVLGNVQVETRAAARQSSPPETSRPG